MLHIFSVMSNVEPQLKIIPDFLPLLPDFLATAYTGMGGFKYKANSNDGQGFSFDVGI